MKVITWQYRECHGREIGRIFRQSLFIQLFLSWHFSRWRNLWGASSEFCFFPSLFTAFWNISDHFSVCTIPRHTMIAEPELDRNAVILHPFQKGTLEKSEQLERKHPQLMGELGNTGIRLKIMRSRESCMSVFYCYITNYHQFSSLIQ